MCFVAYSFHLNVLLNKDIECQNWLKPLFNHIWIRADVTDVCRRISPFQIQLLCLLVNIMLASFLSVVNMNVTFFEEILLQKRSLISRL